MTQEKFSTAAPQTELPLLRFKGTLAEYVRREARRDNPDGSSRNSVFCDLKFTDVEPLEIQEGELYPWPTATVSIGYQPPSTSFGNTRWDAFAKSLRNLYPDVPPEDRIDKMVGQQVEMHRGEATIRQPERDEDGNIKTNSKGGQVWSNQTGLAWQVVSVNGVGTGGDDLLDYLAALADGKQEGQFYQAALQDQKVISRTDIVTAITNREILNTMTMSGKVTRDAEGTLHRA